MINDRKWEHADLIYTEDRRRQLIVYRVDGLVREVDLGQDEAGLDPRQSESGILLLARLELAGWELVTPDSASCAIWLNPHCQFKLYTDDANNVENFRSPYLNG